MLLLLGHGLQKSGAFREFCVLTLLPVAQAPKDNWLWHISSYKLQAACGSTHLSSQPSPDTGRSQRIVSSRPAWDA